MAILSRNGEQEAKGDIRPNQELHETNQQTHGFLELLGHELQNSVAAIRKALCVLEQQGDDAVTRERVRSLMERQTQCMERVVEESLPISPLKPDRTQLRNQLLDPAAAEPIFEPYLVPSVALAVQSRKSVATGKYVSVSYFRRLVADLMHFSAKVPTATIERHMNLAGLFAARRACSPAPTWSAIFTRAYAVVAARTPSLRTSYLSFPWPRLYENAANGAIVNIDRQVAGERVILYAHVPSPENLTLRELDAIINAHRNDPVDSISSYRAAFRLSRVPWPFRRLVWWAALNLFGSVRGHHFGTFGVSSVGAMGASITRLTPLLTSQLHYGMFDAAGGVDMRLSFDHRVVDGATVAVALAEMEEVLRGDITQECTDAARE